MSAIMESARKKNYIPIMGDDKGCISFQGTAVNVWMWTGKVTEFESGEKQVKTARVTTLKELADHYHKDNWIPVEPLSDDMLRSMEVELGGNIALQHKTIPSEYLKADADVSGLVVKSRIDSEGFKAFIKQKKRESLNENMV